METTDRSRTLAFLLRYDAGDFKDSQGYVEIDVICDLLPPYNDWEVWTRHDIGRVVATSINDLGERRFEVRYTNAQVSHVRARASTRQLRLQDRSRPYRQGTPMAQPPPGIPRGLQPGSSTAVPKAYYLGRLSGVPEAPPPSLPKAPPPASLTKAPPPKLSPPPALLPKAPPPELSPPPELPGSAVSTQTPRNGPTCVICYDRSPAHAFIHARGTRADDADIVAHPLICSECLSRAKREDPMSLQRCPSCRVETLWVIPFIQ
jgi:hypothetical protein